MELTVKFLNGKTYSLNVSPSITVKQLKQNIESQYGYPAQHMMLAVQNGQTNNLEKEDCSLDQYGLKPGTIVTVLITEPKPMQVFLKNDKGQTKPYEIQPGETVTQFKQKVYRGEKVPTNQMILIYEGKQLEDGRKMDDYNIQSNKTIYLQLRLRGG
ncbi:polyubiquitin-B-like isoform X5 [Erpetoichthys calabaricus]|uniref:polyubiquitin-B-like isoform X5 n=1 Tax=Erpetoichthys calabaricus TaxID=27687 RepID=UPI0022344A63|nr:polyubiquitin-B-like isoform X5 [Erpetoichthys calabaricus]